MKRFIFLAPLFFATGAFATDLITCDYGVDVKSAGSSLTSEMGNFGWGNDEITLDASDLDTNGNDDRKAKLTAALRVAFDKSLALVEERINSDQVPTEISIKPFSCQFSVPGW